MTFKSLQIVTLGFIALVSLTASPAAGYASDVGTNGTRIWAASTELTERSLPDSREWSVSPRQGNDVTSAAGDGIDTAALPPEYVAASVLNMRERPGTGFRVVDTARFGNGIDIHCWKFGFTGDKAWFYATFWGGLSGWVYSPYVHWIQWPNYCG
jgi:hypothetical protein